MKFGQQDQPRQRERRKSRKRKTGSLAAHRVFAPMLGLWGMLLAGLTIMVVPPALIDQSLRGTTIASSGQLVQPVLAVLAALLLGGGFFVIAAGVSRRVRQRAGAPSVAERAVRSVRPIDPVRDLGSRSLDDPLETMPFATPAWRDADPQAPQAAPAKDTSAAPRELDLASFAQLPGRNAVWVEEAAEPELATQTEPEPLPLTAPMAEPVASEPVVAPVVGSPVTALRKAAALPDPGTAALTRLRAVAPSELSLVEMVERFAGALHEHRANPPSRSLTAADLAAREAALAEALKALAALSGESVENTAPDPLRAALSQLQTRRGVA